ncbi:MAG: FtsX-like permease family protein [Gemmatimonadetes bacterium]|nr:FtsX-like permease family protein [Gemmatimonadota bacterium]
MAVGASRWRVIRGSLIESLLLALAGGTLGILLATWGARALGLLWPREFLSSADHEIRAMSPESIAVDGTVLVFCALASVVAAVAIGLWPALRTSSVNLSATLKDGGSGLKSRRGGWDPRSILIAAQVGLALVLVVGTGLVGSSIARILDADRGFGAENVLAFRYDLPATSALAEHPTDFHDELRERVLRLPSVESVTTGCPPLRGHCWGITRVDAIEGREAIPQGEGPLVGITLVGDSYFETLDVGLLSGRTLGPDDGLDGQPTGVINQRAASLLFPDEDPIGKRIQVGVSQEDKDPFVEIVGVVENVMYDTPDQEQYAELYYSYREFPDRSVWMLARTTSDPTAVVPLVRGELSQMAPDVAMAGVTTIEDIVDGSVGDRRVLFTLLVVFAALTLALSATGTWGVVANAVVERRRELGLRLALGAAHGGVVGLVLRAALGAAAAGIVLGTLVALGGSRVLSAFLYETSQSDPVAYALAAALLLAVVALAAWLPAKRATRVDPVEALRAE